MEEGFTLRDIYPQIDTVLPGKMMEVVGKLLDIEELLEEHDKK